MLKTAVFYAEVPLFEIGGGCYYLALLCEAFWVSEHNSTLYRSELLCFCVYSPVATQEAVVLHDYGLDI